MFKDQDRFSTDIFQRRVGEDSDSNEDSDILDGKLSIIKSLIYLEQIQYSIEIENQDTNTNSKFNDKNNFNNQSLNKDKDNRLKKNKQSENFYNYEGEDYYNTINKSKNYRNQDNYKDAYDYLNDNELQKKGKIIKKKNYSYYDNYDNNYGNNYNNNNGYYKYYRNNNRNYYNSYKEKPYHSNYYHKKNDNLKDGASKTQEKELKSFQNSSETININSKKQDFNKYDNLNQNDKIVIVTNNSYNNINEYQINKNMIDLIDNCPTSINLNEFVGKLNVNAKEFLPRNYNQFKYQR